MYSNSCPEPHPQQTVTNLPTYQPQTLTDTSMEKTDCCEQKSFLICAPSQPLPQPIDAIAPELIQVPACTKWGNAKNLAEVLAFLCADGYGADGLTVPKGQVGVLISDGTQVVIEPCLPANLVCGGGTTLPTTTDKFFGHYYLTGTQPLSLSRQRIDLTNIFATGASLGNWDGANGGLTFTFSRKARVSIDAGFQIRVQSSTALSAANRIICTAAIGIERATASSSKPPSQEYRIFEIDRAADGQPHTTFVRAGINTIVDAGDKLELRSILSTNPTVLPASTTVTATATPDGGAGLSILEI